MDEGRPAVRARVRHFGFGQLHHQVLDFLPRQARMGLDGCLAGGLRNLLLQQMVRAPPFSGCFQDSGHIRQQDPGRRALKTKWQGIHNKCIAAELGDAKAHLLQQLEMPAHPQGIARRQIYRLGHQQALAFNPTMGHLRHEALI